LVVVEMAVFMVRHILLPEAIQLLPQSHLPVAVRVVGRYLKEIVPVMLVEMEVRVEVVLLGGDQELPVMATRQIQHQTKVKMARRVLTVIHILPVVAVVLMRMLLVRMVEMEPLVQSVVLR